jgi:hypothetical protein
MSAAADSPSPSPRPEPAGTPEDRDSQAVGAQTAPQTALDRILAFVPRALSSHAHIIFLAILGVYLVIVPLLGVDVSAKAELIGGNYTNVTSDLGACIAAGMTVHLVKRDRRRSRELEELFRHLHARHDTLESVVQQAASAASRAEAAARNQG